MNQTMTQTHPLSDPIPVLEWFKSLPADAVVGHGGYASDCPLAHYLLSRGYGEPAVVGYGYSVGGVFFHQEEWAKLFVYYVDTAFNNLPVTAYDAAYMVECALQELERRKNSPTDPVSTSLWKVASLLMLEKLKGSDVKLETKELVPA